MSISTTRKLIVRGKSVDFWNREGSSPSIPKTKKGLVRLPNFLLYSLFSLRVHNSLSFFSHPFDSFTNISGLFFFYFHKSCDRYKTHTNKHFWAKQKIENIPSPEYRILENFVVFFFNWHRPKSFSKIKKMTRWEWSG